MPKEPIYLFSYWTLLSVAVDLSAEPFVLRGNKGGIDLLAANSYLFPPSVLNFVPFSGSLRGKVQSAWKQKGSTLLRDNGRSIPTKRLRIPLQKQ